jgi:hypothetical protein
MAMDDEWFYADRGQQRGPIPFADLQARAAAGLLQPTDLVWKTGMAEWRPASSQPGLFGDPAPRIPTRQPRDFDDRPEPNEFRRPRPARGSGWRIPLLAGGAIMLCGLLCCGVIAAIFFANQGPKNERTWRLDTGQSTTFSIPFNQGDKVDIKVTSVSDSDVDLFVFDSKNNLDRFMQAKNIDNVAKELCLRYDNTESKDCHVTFLAAKTQDYWAVVVNRKSVQPGRNMSNSGKLVFEPAPK